MAKNLTELHVMVLQNGHPIAETIKPVKRWLDVSITSGFKGDLSLPLYPLAREINLFNFVSGHLNLNLDQAWSGFIVINGEVLELDKIDREEKQYKIKLNDYGSICLKDLRIIFKVISPIKKIAKKVPKVKAYRGSLFNLFIQDSNEFKGMVLATFLSAFITLGFCFLMLNNNTKRPKNFGDLSQTYTLPFIDPDNLKTSPEALQDRISRHDLVGSIIKFYKDFTEVLLNWEPDERDHYIYPTTKKYYAALYSDVNERKEKNINLQKQLDLNQSKIQATGIFKIPSVIGENNQQKFLRLLDKIDIIHSSYETLLDERRYISKDFKKDEPYNWGTYNQSNAAYAKRANYLSQIRVFKANNNEQMMYLEADDLANIASLKQDKLFKNTSFTSLNQNSNRAIKIKVGSKYASFLASSLGQLSENKLNQIQASKYGNRVNKIKIREPLVGEIAPALIEKTVSRNKFQLQLCYELALRRQKISSGSMNWQWRIDSRGKISDIKLLQSTIRDKKMEACIKRKMALWKFPRPSRGSVEVNHSFHFVPRKG